MDDREEDHGRVRRGLRRVAAQPAGSGWIPRRVRGGRPGLEVHLARRRHGLRLHPQVLQYEVLSGM